MHYYYYWWSGTRHHCYKNISTLQDMALDLVSSLCVGTTIFIVAFWIALTPVEADVVDDINWFGNLNLSMSIILSFSGTYLQTYNYWT